MDGCCDHWSKWRLTIEGGSSSVPIEVSPGIGQVKTEVMAKMVRPVTSLWKVRVFKIEIPKMTSKMTMPTIILLVLSWNQFCALAKALPGKATPSKIPVSWILCTATIISKPMMVSADPTSVQLSSQPQNGPMIREVKT